MQVTAVSNVVVMTDHPFDGISHDAHVNRLAAYTEPVVKNMTSMILLIIIVYMVQY